MVEGSSKPRVEPTLQSGKGRTGGVVALTSDAVATQYLASKFGAKQHSSVALHSSTTIGACPSRCKPDTCGPRRFVEIGLNPVLALIHCAVAVPLNLLTLTIEQQNSVHRPTPPFEVRTMDALTCRV